MTTAGSAIRRGSRTWIVLLVLLTISIFINYLDRSNLSIAAPLLQRDLAISTPQLGILFSAFFWTYSLLQLFGISGWISDRFAVGPVFGFSCLLWGLSTIATGFLSSLTALFAMRLVLGAGESVAYPCYSRIVINDIPELWRGRANSFLDAGSKLGPALGTLLGGLLLARYGWRIFFIMLGAAGLLWLIPWLRWMPRRSASAVRSAAIGATAKPNACFSVRRMLQLRSCWGAFGGHFCGNYFWFFLLIWLPSYLIKERDFSIERMAAIGSAAYFAIAAATLSAGWLSDRLIGRGHSTTRVRKSIVMGGLGGSAIILPVAFVQNPTVSIALLFAACLCFGTYTSNHWAITQTLAGPVMAGRWTGLQNGVGNLSGIVASWLTGFLVGETGSFHIAFIVSAAIAITGVMMWGMVVGPVEQVPWEGAPNAA